MARKFSGQALRRERRAAGISPERLAVAVERSVFSIQSYELGRVKPAADVLPLLADAIGVPMDRFFVEESLADG